MTRILWNFSPSYLGLNQLVTILMDLPLAAVRINRRTPRRVGNGNSPRRDRNIRGGLFPVGVKCTWRAIVRARGDLCKDAGRQSLKNGPILHPQWPFCSLSGTKRHPETWRSPASGSESVQVMIFC